MNWVVVQFSMIPIKSPIGFLFSLMCLLQRFSSYCSSWEIMGWVQLILSSGRWRRPVPKCFNRMKMVIICPIFQLLLTSMWV